MTRRAFLIRSVTTGSVLVLAAIVTALAVENVRHTHALAFDFHHDFWVAGSLVRHGLSPYHWTRADIAALRSFPYPAPAAILFVPFSLIGRGVADAMFASICFASGLLAMWVLRVRDLRAYAAFALWAPFISGWEAGNLTLPLVLGTAIVWRHRDSGRLAGTVVGALLAVKPTVWPLLVFLLFTRRHRALAIAVLTALVLNVIAWSIVGIHQIGSWWHLLGLQTGLMYRDGYGVAALASHVGLGRGAGTAVQYAAAAMVAAGCAWLSWRERERAAIVATVVLILVAAPLLDSHYFAFLVIAIAVYWRRVSTVWWIPFAFWFCPALHVTGTQASIAWLTVAAVVVWLGTRAHAPRAMSRPGRAPAPVDDRNVVLVDQTVGQMPDRPGVVRMVGNRGPNREAAIE